ncbi:hypothetical protein AB685_06725 [Bacillus sp. LL01]|uniref:hypothetical protein n=1 Tax=Bacillus sp. LL01 TaxID=1665556 RepID=UPI00064D00FE|nr:hypothetical protein [Bacillus sp. LL01]KMJ58771.1 hypothetical protein AB685_06725 [Bacillus sp. LL01]
MFNTGGNKKERNKRIKVKAIQVENQLNQALKDVLNRESVFRVVGLESEIQADKLRMVRDQVEVLSLKYNFPTKNDVANIAKMLIQIEEKIDRLEAQLHDGNLQEDQTGKQDMNQKKKMVKVLMEDMVQSQAILSKLPGYDAKVVRLKAGGQDGG